MRSTGNRWASIGISFLMVVGLLAAPLSPLADTAAEAQFSTEFTVCDICEFPTIQAAINAADPGDVITVDEGTYVENLSITKNITIVGSGASSTIVDGSGGSSSNGTVSVPTGPGLGVSVDEASLGEPVFELRA
ncbi:MAG: pectinesterase family protein [Acidimicrobiia bacterium]|nr:pectinesterase family protein [Acidimicrobiia bacterium]